MKITKSQSCAVSFIPPLLLTVSHFTFVFPNGYAKRPFSPTFELLPSQIFMLPLKEPRYRGVKKEGRDFDLSIKDEQHLKCIKVVMKTPARGWRGVNHDLMLNDTW